MKTFSLLHILALMSLPLLLLRVACAAPPEVTFEKLQLTDSYYCDGVDAGRHQR